MDDDLYTSIIKYLKEGIVPRDKDTRKSQA